jgi:hypothetical protein
MRPVDSAVDQAAARATRALLAALRQEGYAVDAPVTGHVLVTGQGRTLDLAPAEWDRLCAWPIDEAVAAVAERLAAPVDEDPV